MFAKLIIVVDEDVNVQDLSYTAWRVLNNVDWKRDVVISEGPLATLTTQPISPAMEQRMGIDATRKTREEGMTRDWPDEIWMSDEIKKTCRQEMEGIRFLIIIAAEDKTSAITGAVLP